MNLSGHKAPTLPLLCVSLGLVGCQAFRTEPALDLPGAVAEQQVQAPPAAPAEQAATALPAMTPSFLPEPTQAIPASSNAREMPSGNITKDLDQNLSLPEPDLAAKRNSRRWQLANELRESTGWNLFESDSYFIATPIDNPLLIEGAKRRLDALRERLLEDLPPGLNRQVGERPLLRFLPNRAAFEASGARRGSTAQWISAENTLVCFDAGSEAQREENTWPALQHVLVHEHLSSTLQIKDAPSWLLYGLAARYEALRFEATPEGGHWEAADTTLLAQALSEAVAAEGPMPLSRLMGFTPQEFFGVNEFGSGAYRNLVLARSFVSFCWTPGASPGTRAPSRFLESFTGSLANGQAPQAALDHARGSKSLQEIELAWRKWIELATGRTLPEGP